VIRIETEIRTMAEKDAIWDAQITWQDVWDAWLDSGGALLMETDDGND
jgi:hypothetical protein